MSILKTFIVEGHKGAYLPAISVIMAYDAEEARKLLSEELVNLNMAPLGEKDVVRELPRKRKAHVLFDGDY